MSKEIDVFALERPKNFRALLTQIEFISNDLKKWLDKLIDTNNTAQKNIEIISEDEIKDAFHNLSQNFIDLSKLIQKKVWGM